MWRQSDNVLNPPSTYFLSNSLAGLWAVTSGAEIVYIMFYADSELSSASSDQFLTPKVTSYASNTRLLSIRYSPTWECHYELGGGYLFNSCRTEEFSHRLCCQTRPHESRYKGPASRKRQCVMSALSPCRFMFWTPFGAWRLYLIGNAIQYENQFLRLHD